MAPPHTFPHTHSVTYAVYCFSHTNIQIAFGGWFYKRLTTIFSPQYHKFNTFIVIEFVAPARITSLRVKTE